VQFALQFEALTLPPDQADDAAQPAQPKAKPPVSEKSQEKKPAGRTSVPATRAPTSLAADAGEPDAPVQQAADDKPGAEVVRLDRFRKK
jgi:hypothetical protein